jgi:hypothetical protein
MLELLTPYLSQISILGFFVFFGFVLYKITIFYRDSE